MCGILFGLPHHRKTPKRTPHHFISENPPPCGSISNLLDFPNPQKEKKKRESTQYKISLFCSDFSNSRRN